MLLLLGAAAACAGPSRPAPAPGDARDAPAAASRRDVTDEIAAQIAALADPSSRAGAEAWLLAHADQAHPALVAAADRFGVARVLGRLGRPDDVPVLVRLVTQDPTSAVSWNAAMAIGVHPDGAARQALVSLLAHDDVRVLGNALAAVGLRGDPSMRPIVEGMLADPRAEVRRQAVLTLVDLGAAPSAQPLEQLRAREQDPEVRRAIDRAIGAR